MSTSPETLTGVALAIAVMSEAAKAEGQAEKTLDKRKGASWAAVQEAAGAFSAEMTAAEKTALSGQLAKVYAKFYPAASAKVVASQHARAIFLIATGSPSDGYSNVAAFLSAHKIKPVKGSAGASKGGSDDGEGGDDSGAGEAPTKPAQGSILSGASVELGSAIARLVEASKRMPELETALLIAANHPAGFIKAMEALLLAPKGDKGLKLAA